MIIFWLATHSFVSVFPVENEKVHVLQNISCCISIDAKFDADFKNVYFFLLILTSFRFISEKLPILVPVQENMQKRQFFAYKSETSQNKKEKVYIFGISVKFCVDWYATWHTLKNINFFIFYRKNGNKWASSKPENDQHGVLWSFSVF